MKFPTSLNNIYKKLFKMLTSFTIPIEKPPKVTYSTTEGKKIIGSRTIME